MFHLLYMGIASKAFRGQMDIFAIFFTIIILSIWIFASFKMSGPPEYRVLDLIENRNKVALVSIKYSSAEHRKINIMGLKEALKNANEFFNSSLNNSLMTSSFSDSKEMHVLNKLVYLMNGAFRKHRFFQLIKRVIKIYRKIGDLTLLEKFNDFFAMIQLQYDDTCFCFSAESMDHLVANLMAAINLVSTIPELCVDCYKSLGSFLDKGHFVVQCCLVVGCTAVLRSQSIACGRKLCELYSVIFPYTGGKLKANDASYNILYWPNSVKTEAFAECANNDLYNGTEKLKECMKFFERLLKDYNKTMDFKLGLHRVLIEKAANSSITNDLSKSTDLLGTVVDRNEDPTFQPKSFDVQFEAIKSQIIEIQSVKNVKNLIRLCKTVLESNDLNGPSSSAQKIGQLKKCSKILRVKYSKTLATKKNSNEKLAELEMQQLKKRLKAVFGRIKS